MPKATKEQIEAWKAEHPDVIEVEVEGKYAYLRKPDRTIIRRIGLVGNRDKVKQAEMLLDLCWLGGDDVIKTDDELFFAAMPALEELQITQKEAVIKKL